MAVAVIGFLIAVAIGLTGVGAGMVTAPVLITVFHVPPAAAVGSALLFGAVTKVLIVPVYALRRQIDIKSVMRMFAGGIPGVLTGSFRLSRIDTRQYRPALSLLIGLTIVIFAIMSVYRLAYPSKCREAREQPWLLSLVAAPIGVEVGFSSAGSGSLAALALMGCTRLPPAMVVGTDLCFGLGLSVIGGGILLADGIYDAATLPQLLCGGICGAIVAPNLAAFIPARALRLGLLLWIAVLGGNLVVKALVH